jgi:hypothetical protein
VSAGVLTIGDTSKLGPRNGRGVCAGRDSAKIFGKNYIGAIGIEMHLLRITQSVANLAIRCITVFFCGPAIALARAAFVAATASTITLCSTTPGVITAIGNSSIADSVCRLAPGATMGVRVSTPAWNCQLKLQKLVEEVRAYHIANSIC